MGLFSALWGHSSAQEQQQVWGQPDCTSPAMRRSIQDWSDLYYGTAPNPDTDLCQRLPVVIVQKLCKTVFSEYQASSSIPTVAGLLQKLNQMKRQALALALVGGECFIKPVIHPHGMDFLLVRREGFIPFARDAQGQILSMGLTEQTWQDGWYYSLVERRTVGEDGRLVLENRLYRSKEATILGGPVSLSTLPQYAQLKPYMKLPVPLWNVGMGSLRTPLLNTVDGSNDPVSVYAPAVGLIRNINRNERQLCDEFENGASRLIVSSDLLTTDGQGNKKLSDKLFVGIDDNPDDVGVTIFSPTLREQSYLARKQEYLRNVESLIGLKRGLLSEVEAVERTATEITSSAGDYNLTIQDFQWQWEEMLRGLMATCLLLGEMYHLWPATPFDPQKDVVIDWGNGILYDEDKTWADYMALVAAGMLKPELALAWKFNLPHDTPAELAAIRETYMPGMEELLPGG